MATTTTHKLAPQRPVWRSTVAKKILMAVTGLILIMFLLGHMAGNLKLLIPVPTTGENAGVSEFSEYAHYLRRLLYPALPPMAFLWGFRLLLVAAVAGHMWAAFKLRARRDRNVGGKRYVKSKALSRDYAGRTMFWGGIIIVLFLILHLLQFTIVPKAFGVNPNATPDGPRTMVIHAFSNPIYVLVYALAMLAVCSHVWHGFWSAFATLGLNVSKRAERVLKICAWIFSVTLYVGFMISPLAVLTKVVS